MQRDLEFATWTDAALQRGIKNRLELVNPQSALVAEHRCALALDVCAILVEQHLRAQEAALFLRGDAS